MSAGGAGPLVPTFHGFVHNSMDGLILFEACLSGKLHHVPRRPHDRERNSLIKSGSIFIYEENASGIKRWTDGVAWSPSRILGNFLIYRELEKPFPPGEKKRAMKRKRTSLPGEPYPRRDSDGNDNGSDMQRPLTPPTPNVSTEAKSENPVADQDKELERSLIGSLVDSYGFRPDGLVKKTMSISVNGISHHMVSYYKVDDVKNNILPRPLTDARLANISVRPELYLKQNFRAPVEETEHYAIDGQMHAHPQVMYSQMSNQGYGVRPGQYFGSQYPAMYSGVNTTSGGMYGSTLPATSWPTQSPSGSAVPYGSHPSYGNQSYGSYYKGGPQAPSNVKPEDSQGSSQPLSYGNSYATPYPATQRDMSQSSAGMMQPAYPPPMPQQPSASSYGSMSAPSSRPPYGNPSTAPSSIGQSHAVYGATQGGQSLPSQQYGVRSPAHYGMPSLPQSGSTRSPHPDANSVAATRFVPTRLIRHSAEQPHRR
jgi:hypothetical protein